MRAILAEGGRPVVRESPLPDRPDEALVRVTVAGICGTDLEILQGYMEFRGILGHEFVGIVEQAPDPGWVGRRVVGEINVPCRTCETCLRGLDRFCPARTVLGISGRDGAFAEYLSLPLSNLHPVPAGVSDDAAVFVEPIAAACEILEQDVLPDGAATLVLGDGRLGQLCARVLQAAGNPPTVVGNHPEKLALLERRGLRTETSAAELPRAFDVVVDATGKPEGLREAIARVRPRGTIVLKSTYRGGADLDLSGIVIDEIRVVGSRCGPFEPAIDLLTRDRELTNDLVSASFSLGDVSDAVEHASRPDALKVLLRP